MEKQRNSNLVGGMILILLGIMFSFRTFFDINVFHYIGKLWPLAIIGLGVWLIIKDKPTDSTGLNN